MELGTCVDDSIVELRRGSGRKAHGGGSPSGITRGKEPQKAAGGLLGETVRSERLKPRGEVAAFLQQDLTDVLARIVLGVAVPIVFTAQLGWLQKCPGPPAWGPH